MEIIKPWIEVEKYDIKRILKNIEKACRTCYRSEDLINDDSYKDKVVWILLKVLLQISLDVELCLESLFSKNKVMDKWYIFN